MWPIKNFSGKLGVGEGVGEWLGQRLMGLSSKNKVNASVCVCARVCMCVCACAYVCVLHACVCILLYILCDIVSTCKHNSSFFHLTRTGGLFRFNSFGKLLV